MLGGVSWRCSNVIQRRGLQTRRGDSHRHDDHALKNTTFYGGSVYSTDKPNSDPNTGIRVYGDWYHKHTETGKEVSHKWMALVWFNEAGKIYEFRDFFDVNGFLKQHVQ